MIKAVQVTRVDEGVARVHLDDEQHQNRLTEGLVDELMAALRALAEDDTLKAVVLTGRHDVFCGGGTREMLLSVVGGGVSIRDLELPACLVEFPVPVIAALEGAAVGAGLAMALCCDMTVAAASSRYGMNFTSMGFTPGLGATGLLPSMVGHGFAMEMLLTSKLYRGRELERRGIFTHVVASPEVLRVAQELARRIAIQPRHVTTMLKADLCRGRREILSAAMSREHVMHAACFARPDARVTIESGYFEPAHPPGPNECIGTLSLHP